MNKLSKLINTSVGRKQLMAISGLLLALFLIAHLSGNLLLLKNDNGEAFNAYAKALSDLGALKIIAQIGLAALFLFHIYLGFLLSGQNRKARIEPYHYKEASDATLGSRTMIYSGVLVGLFLAIHLFNFTWADHSVPLGLYGVVLAKFTDPLWVGFYILSMITLGLHLSHGVQSLFQSLGFNHPVYTPLVKKAGIGLAVLVSAGFSLIPIWLMITKGGA